MALPNFCVRCGAVCRPSHRHAIVGVGDVDVWRENDCERVAGSHQVLQK